MGLFSSIFSSPKTKAEWDEKIMDLNNELAHAKLHVQSVKNAMRGAKDRGGLTIKYL